MTTRTHDQNTLLLGSSNRICDECGFKFKRIDIKKKWNGSYVCKDCWESRHPSDLYQYMSRDGGGGAILDGSAKTDDDGTQTGTSVSGQPIPPDPTPVNITTTSLGTVLVDTAFSLQLATDVAVVDPLWEVTVGALPTGLSMSSTTGLITGTPTVAGESYSVTIKVTNQYTTVSDTQAYSGYTSYGYPLTWTTGLKSAQTTQNTRYGGSYVTGISTLNGKPFHHGDVSSKYYDVDTDTWDATGITHLNTNPTSYSYMEGIVNQVDGCYYTLQNAGSSVMNVKKYDPVADAWTTETTLATNVKVGYSGYLDRYAMADTSASGVYDWMLFCGFCNSTGGGWDVVWGYSSATASIVRLTEPFPQALYQCNAAGLTDGTVIIQGYNNTFLKAWRYYPTTDSYVAIADTPIPMYSAPIAYGTPDGKALFGGGLSTGAGATKKVMIYDPDLDSWSYGTDLPLYTTIAGGHYCSHVLADNRLFVSVGSQHAAYATSSYIQLT